LARRRILAVPAVAPCDISLVTGIRVQAMQLMPDVVVMDLLMPGVDGAAGARRIRQDLPRTEVVALTSVLESTSVLTAIEAGAIAYLIKDTRAADLLQTIKAAAAGQVQLSHKLAARLIDELPFTCEASLGPDDQRILQMIARGLTNQQMADACDVNEGTIRTEIDRVLAKIGALGRARAALYAVSAGLISVDQLGATNVA
jgi:DNA-binding NarL/FixJ family response regulator